MKEGERERQAEGEAGFMQGAQCGTRSRVSRITPWAEGGAKLLSHPGIPSSMYFFKKDFIYLFMRDTERGRDTGRGRSRLHAGSQTWDLIPGLQVTPWAEGRC